MSDRVYAIQGAHTRLIKIGRATSFENRLRDLQTGSAEPLLFVAGWVDPDAIDLERALHSRIAAYRVNGEWFYPSPTVRRLCNSAEFRGATVRKPTAATRRIRAAWAVVNTERDTETYVIT